MSTKKKKRSVSTVARARLLNADDAAVMALMALTDGLTALEKLVSIARMLGAGKQAEEQIQKWAHERFGA